MGGVLNAVEWVPLESRVITSAAYRAGARQLYLQFRKGDIYRYFECARSVYKALLSAESKGRYFAQHIRNEFRCERVHREDQAGSSLACDSRDLSMIEQLRNSILLAKVRTIQELDAADSAACSHEPAELTYLSCQAAWRST